MKDLDLYLGAIGGIALGIGLGKHFTWLIIISVILILISAYLLYKNLKNNG